MIPAKNTGTSYEQLARQVFEAILQQDGVTNIAVQHNTTLRGKAASHQIDVYWEFAQGGIVYRTVVQCKDWNSRVKQEQLFAFKTVLDDLPGQPRGIVVARAGFQQGAREFAAAHGILLYELREPQREDWDGFVSEVNIEMRMHAPVVHAFRLVPDVEWMRTEKLRLGLGDELIQVELRGRLGDLVFRREDDSLISNAGDMVERLLPPTGQRECIQHRFDAPAFIALADETVRRVKVLGFDVDVELTLAFNQILRIDVVAIVSFILKNAIDGSFRSLDAGGHPFAPPQK